MFDFVKALSAHCNDFLFSLLEGKKREVVFERICPDREIFASSHTVDMGLLFIIVTQRCGYLLITRDNAYFLKAQATPTLFGIIRTGQRAGPDVPQNNTRDLSRVLFI